MPHGKPADLIYFLLALEAACRASGCWCRRKPI
jgi:hypothetical protein